ncbi:MAG: LuxR family transcriptional regulator [Paracoccaceae bacterium]
MPDRDDILSRIATTPSPAQLWATVIEHYLSNGIARISYHAGRATRRPGSIVCYGYPRAWVRRYLDSDLEAVDPIPALAASTPTPVLWSQIARRDDLTAPMTAYLREMDAALDCDGLAFNVFGPRLRAAYVGLGFAPGTAVPDRPGIAHLQMVAQMAHLHLCDLTGDAPQLPPALSPREREVTEWMVRGKSNGVIAELLGISTHTVDTLLRRVFAKLGVVDRTSAAVAALASGAVRQADPDVTRVRDVTR